jgi:aryl-alcohol dehydrogenase-like predicted oxidoreductase
MLRQSIERSLRLLKTDHLDVLQLHSCSLDILRQGDVITVIQEAKAAGKTRFIGYSGDGQDAVYAIESGVFDTLQTSVNVFDQESITLTLPKAKAANMGVIVKRPIGNVAWHNGDQPPTSGYARTYWDRLQKLKYSWADPAKMEESVSIALRFTLAQPGVHTAIVGTQNPDRWVQNAKLLEDGELDQSQIDEIRTIWEKNCEPGWVGQQ